LIARAATPEIPGQQTIESADQRIIVIR